METKRAILSISMAAFFLLQPAVSARAAGAQAANENPHAAEIQQKVEAAGVGAQVEVRLFDKNTLRGSLASVNSKDFVVITGQDQNAVVHKIRFEDVKSFKARGQEASSNTNAATPRVGRRGRLLLIVGVAALVFGVITYATTKGP